MKNNVNIIEVKLLSRVVAIKYNNYNKTNSWYNYYIGIYIPDLGILL